MLWITLPSALTPLATAESPPFNLILYYGVNGYLFGREYFEIVAFRRLTPAETKRLRRRYGMRLFLAGILLTVMMTIPLVNLFAPIVAAAFMVHIFEGLRRPTARRSDLASCAL